MLKCLSPPSSLRPGSYHITLWLILLALVLLTTHLRPHDYLNDYLFMMLQFSLLFHSHCQKFGQSVGVFLVSENCTLLPLLVRLKSTIALCIYWQGKVHPSFHASALLLRLVTHMDFLRTGDGSEGEPRTFYGLLFCIDAYARLVSYLPQCLIS